MFQFCLLFLVTLTDLEEKILGETIFASECGKKRENLLFWNAKEAFPSFGIGHFIWYPANLQERPFEETFPLLLSYLQEQGKTPPRWVVDSRSAPWTSRDEFLAASKCEKMEALRLFLEETKKEQAAFIARRMEKEIHQILTLLSREKQREAEALIDELTKTHTLFPLYDYLHFKGSGLKTTEQYKGKGWGLLQVLENIDPTKPALQAFCASCKERLTDRVNNSPPEKGESRFLSGWLHRIDRYKNSPF